MANTPAKYPSSPEEFRDMFPKSDRPGYTTNLLEDLPRVSASSRFARTHLEFFRVLRQKQEDEDMEQFFGPAWEAAVAAMVGAPAWEELELYSRAELEQRPVAELQYGAPRFGTFYAHLAQLFVPAAESATESATSADAATVADSPALKSRLRPRDAIKTPKSAPGFVSGAGLALSGSEATLSSPVNPHPVNPHPPNEDDGAWEPRSGESTRSTHYARAKSEAATVQMALDFLTTVVSLYRAPTDDIDVPETAHQPHRHLEWTPSTSTFDVQLLGLAFTAINDGSLAWAWNDGTKRVRDKRVLCSLEAKSKYAAWLTDGVTKAPLPDNAVAQWVAQLIGMISQNALGEGPATGGEVFLVSATANYLKLVRATYSPAYVAYLKGEKNAVLDRNCFLELTEWPECNMATPEGRLLAATFVIALVFHLEGK